MKSVEFCYWLQGYFELNPPGALTAEQTQCVRAHLALVFKHEIDPSYPNGPALDAIHETTKAPADEKPMTKADVEKTLKDALAKLPPRHEGPLVMRC